MSAHHQGCKWHGHELRHEVSSSVCGCDDQLMQHKPECPASWGVGEMPEGPCTFCEMLSACEERVTERWESLRGWGESYAYKTGSDNGFDVGYTAGLDTALEAVAALHRPVPVILCACGWGKDCLECGSESNRVVGYACHVCCNSFGDHAYCMDRHYVDDTRLHHQDGLMWSGPHCPTMAAIDALREKP